MKPDSDEMISFDDLSDEDFRCLFGATATKQSVQEIYRKQKYQVQRLAGIEHTVVLGESGREHHPYAVVWLPAGWIATGGGAEADWSGNGSLLTMSKGARSGAIHGWQAKAKDHGVPEEVILYVWAIGIRLT